MASGLPRDGHGTRTILGMAPAKFDDVVTLYDSYGNLSTIIYYYAESIVSVTNLLYDVNGNLFDHYVTAS